LGRPDLAEFIKTTDPKIAPPGSIIKPKTYCEVPTCGEGTASNRMCSMHLCRWKWLDRPEIEHFIRTTPAGKQRGPFIAVDCGKLSA